MSGALWVLTTLLGVGVTEPGESVPPHPATVSAVVPDASSWMRLSPQGRARVFEGMKGLPLPVRLLNVSAHFFGTPYVVSPLGEGSGKDPDPRMRFDAVDCLTFIEETIALSLAPTLDEVEEVLTRLRYAHAPTYEDRNHLMEAQWIPNNEAKGFLKDVTALYGGPHVVESAKVLTAGSWASPSSRSLGLPPDRQRVGRFPLRYVPLADLEAQASRVPDGTLLLVVREELESKVTRVTHLGFLVTRDRQVFLRHATKGWKNAVIDEPLHHFLGRVARHNGEAPAWTVVGASLFEVQAPPARLSL